MDQRARDLIKIGDGLFTRRSGLMSLWQEIAEQIYVERADFTANRSDGAMFADNLFGSFPLIARRELGNAFGAMLRPRSAPWFGVHVHDERLDRGKDERAYLEYLTHVQWRAMYDPDARFVDATKQADHDLAAFGNAVIWAGLNSTRSALLHVCHHLRDCAWSENADGEIDALWRKWNPTARQLSELFGDKVSRAVRDAVRSDPDTRIACYHIVVPTRLYQPEARRGARSFPFTCLYVEQDGDTVLEEKGEAWFPYVVPRWATVSGTQYARSPATEIALPDARTFQVVIRTLREAGEKHVDPPMLATVDALRSDIQLYAGGITTVDIEYDERTGEALRPVDRNPGAMPIGFDIAAELKNDIRLGFFLDKLTLPPVDPGKFTAYEFQKRVEQMAREGAPIFEPIEDNYNAPLCRLDFTILKANGAFGGIETVPPSLRGADINFTFRSPFREATEQAKAGLFADGLQRVVLPAAQADPAQLENVDLTQSVQDSLRGLGWPSTWIKDAVKVKAAQAAMAQQKTMAAGMAAAHAAGNAAATVGAGLQSLLTQGAAAPAPARQGARQPARMR